MADKASPTLTLAKLYENQNQFLDALVIYQKLMKTKPSDELQNKINELKEKIFADNTLEYSHTIDKIFTTEDKKKFKILPHEQYKNFKESKNQHNDEETYPEEMIQQKASEKEEPELTELEIKEKEPIEEVPELEKVKDIEEDLKSQADYTVLEVLNQIKELDPNALNEVLIENLGEDRTLDEIKLSDIHNAIELLKSDNKIEDK